MTPFRRKRRRKELAALARRRYLTRDGRFKIKRVGLTNDIRKDWYHWLLTRSTPKLMGVVGITYICINILFALLYLIDSKGIGGAHPGSLVDAFFFSVQTFATIGYGVMTPNSFYANCIVTLETIVGMASVALFTGLMFHHFSKPIARVMFTHFAVITKHDGVPTLMFRAANKRGNQILQAEIRVTLARNEKTLEGVDMRRLYDLTLVRERSSFFSLSWTVMHHITRDSPLYGQTAESLASSETQIVVLLFGVDEGYGQTVHGRYTYNWDEILFNHRFADIIRRDAEKKMYVDYNLFETIEPEKTKDA